MTRKYEKFDSGASGTPGLLVLALAVWGVLASAHGQVTYDGTLGTAVGPNFVALNYDILQADGLTKGKNLFHSFSQFDLLSGQTATFSGANTIQSVMARVTGPGASSIDGRIRSTINGANLFFMNPNGVLFGPNAKIDVKGAFAVTTADYLELRDGVKFTAMAGAGDALLTAADPVAFGFLSASPSGIQLNTASLPGVAGTGGRLTFVGGDITLNSSIVNLPEGRVDLLSQKSPGKIRLDLSDPSGMPQLNAQATLGNIVFQGASEVETSGNSGGVIVVRGGDLKILNGSKLRSNTNGNGAGGLIDIQAGSVLVDGSGSPFPTEISADTNGIGGGGTVRMDTEGAVKILNGATVTSNSTGSGPGGEVRIRAGELVVNGMGNPASTGIFAKSLGAIGAGRGGEIDIVVGGAARLIDGGVISTGTEGDGRGGRLSVKSGEMRIDPRGNEVSFTGISSDTNALSAGGDGGEVEVSVSGPLTIVAGGRISTNTNSAAAGGNIGVTAESIRIDGNGSAGLTGIAALTVAERGGGNGGDVRVDSGGRIALFNGGQISTSTRGDGDGGNVSVKAGDLLAVRGDSPFLTGVTALSETTSVTGGQGGEIKVQVKNGITLRDGGLIDSSTFGSGDAGGVTVKANAIRIDRAGSQFFTGIGSDTDLARRAGRSGSVQVESNSLVIRNGGLVSTSTFGDGDSGSVDVRAQNIDIAGKGVPDETVVTEFSGIFAGTGSKSTGMGGDVTVHGGGIRVSDDGVIGASSQGIGNAGTVQVDAGQITLTTGGSIESSTSGPGDAGDVSVMADSVSIDRAGSDRFTGIGTDTTAARKGGEGGSVAVDTGVLEIRNGGLVSTSTFGSGNAGSLEVIAGRIDVSGKGPANPESLITERSGILAGTGLASTGQGGDVQVQSRQIRLADEGIIGANSLGSGRAGNVGLEVERSLVLDRGGAVTTSSSGAGDAGSVTIDTGSLKATRNSEIASRSDGTGIAGSVEIRSRSAIDFSGGSQVTVESLLTDAGSATLVAADEISFSGGAVNVASQGGNAGTASLIAGTDIFLVDSEVSARAAQNGGSISLAAPDFIWLTNSSLTAEAQGDGGNVTVEGARFMILDDSLISANAVQGTGGDIFIGSEVLLTNNSPITASSQFGAEGTVRIDAIFDLSGALSDLDDNLVDADTELQPKCTVKIPGRTGSFILVGRGGQPIMPGAYLPSHELMPLPVE